MRPYRFVFLLLIPLAGCSGQVLGLPSGDTDAPAETNTPSDTGCTPEGEPLLGDARITCAPGTLEASGACTPTEPMAVSETLTCESYASVGQQIIEQEQDTCATDAGAACCACVFELDASCDPCVIND